MRTIHFRQLFFCPILSWPVVESRWLDRRTASASGLENKFVSVAHSCRAITKSFRREWRQVSATMTAASRTALGDDETSLDTFSLDHVAYPKLPLALIAVLVLLFLPEELSFFIADLRLSPQRAILLMLAPIVAAQLARKIRAGRYRFVASDLFVPLTASWMFIGTTVTYDFGDALKHSGPIALEYFVAYMAARVLLSKPKQSLVFVSWLCVIISIVVIDGLVDTSMGSYVTHEVLGQITGYSVVAYNGDSFRLGLLRAAGPLEHPILLGFTCAIGLLIACAVDVALRPFCVVFCALGVAIAFSSAPQQSVIMGFGLMAYGRLTAAMPGRWMLLVGLGAIFVAVVFATVDSPFGHIIAAMTMTPATGFFRLYIWNGLGPLVLDSPYFGVPQLVSNQVYRGSIDSLWLLLSLQYGVPCAVFAGLAMIGACSRPTRGPRASLTYSESRLGTALGIIIFLIILAGFTVHFWGSTWILIALLVGLRAHLGELAALNATAGAV